MKISKQKVFTLVVYKIKGENGIEYNEIKTIPNLRDKTWDFLGHHFSDNIDNIVSYLESKK